MHVSARRSHILSASEVSYKNKQPNYFFETLLENKLRLRGSFGMKFYENFASAMIIKDHSWSLVQAFYKFIH